MRPIRPDTSVTDPRPMCPPARQTCPFGLDCAATTYVPTPQRRTIVDPGFPAGFATSRHGSQSIHFGPEPPAGRGAFSIRLWRRH